ncbi:1-acyl-sn-glycerol-3-phosphate acyltransferase [Campylobacter sp. CCUG 57310]|uniref:lysophospholipid acyltransferase family protein n=1 Tax=Campylobacter sp. CCUG 57310 TaxID=2517362 RepID=UPI0015632CE3|nr:lysophospholipid acyltransferase family protein [Campylobacter sp. CCUG 57310]QKF92249.1 1-acylglycerol-3-phosphate O-acyltransferase [Campylobacter sp. CCUG 57310]
MIFSRIKAAFFTVTFILSVFWVVFFMWAFNKHNRPIRRIWGRFQRLCGGYSLKIEGEFNDEANMIIMNHQSMLDIIVLEEVHPKNICWLAKKEIKKIPIIGKIIDIPKMIAVDRESKHALVKIVKEAEDRVQNGRVLAIFPEGTRSRTNKLLPFKGGAKIIADKLNLKIQPIVLVGTDILDVTNFSFKNGEVKIICLDLIDTSDKNWLENAREKMQEVYDAELKSRQNAKE